MILLLLTTDLQAQDWLCSEEASIRQGSATLVCGMAVAPTEAQARAIALNNAKIEFSALCTGSSDCVGHYYNMVPKRTQCEEKGNKYKCARLVEYTIGEKIVYVAKYQTEEDIEAERTRKIDAEFAEMHEKNVRDIEEYVHSPNTVIFYPKFVSVPRPGTR
jgi:hypothetical protein